MLLYFNFLLFLDGAFCFFIIFLQLRGFKMTEDSQVQRRKQLFFLAEKVTRYKSHWLFLCLCRNFDVVPNGLKLKKTAQIGKQSNNFLSRWNETLVTVEHNLIDVLIQEYAVVSSQFETEFWNKTVEFLSKEVYYANLELFFEELSGNVHKLYTEIEIRRRRKLVRLIGGRDFHENERELRDSISFFEDIASFINAKRDLQVMEESVISEDGNNVSFDEIQGRMVSHIVENEPPDDAERARTEEEELPNNVNLEEIQGQNVVENEPPDDVERSRTQGEELPNSMNFEELQRQLISDDFENQPPDLMERSRTHGETSSQEEEVSNVDFPFDLDDNGRICGRFENDKVINLSKRALSEAEVSVLSKGLKFVSTPKELDYSQIKIDLENFGRRLRLKWWFKDEEDFSEIPVFRPRSKFNPRHKDVAIEVYLSKIEDEIMKLSAVGKNFSNLTREEISALNGLKSDRTIVIKEADKGSGVVVWDREDYIREAEDQLGDPDVYLPLDNDPSDILHNVVDQAMGRIRQRGDVDDKTLEYLMVNDPKLGRFYLLPKIHKRLNSVPGRPVISNSGFHTENFSEFLDFHLQPLAKSVRSYIKDTNHFLQKIQSLGNLPEDAILCTIDVVALYPSIPHNEGLGVLRKALDSKADRSVSTDSLMDLAEVVLKNNMFEFNGRFYHQIRGTAIGTKCAPPHSILFLADLEEKLLHSYDFKPSVWWRYIDDVFLIWTHGEEELQKFVDCLNASHHPIKFTAEWSKESINFLDTRVIKKDNTLVTDLYTKPTDTHQLLHRSLPSLSY